MVSAAILGMGDGVAPFDPDAGAILFLTIITMVFAPKLASVADILVRSKQRRQFGGTLRVIAGVATEILFSAMLAPIMAVAHTMFMGGLTLGQAIGWGAQARGVERLPVTLALRKLWPQMLFGLAGIAWISGQKLALVWPVVPIAIGPLLAPLIAIATSAKTLGDLAVRSTLWRIPEETSPTAELAELHLPALANHQTHVVDHHEPGAARMQNQ